MTARKTLKVRVPSAEDAAPALKKRGRGWEISEKRLDALHDQARELRRHSSAAHKALAGAHALAVEEAQAAARRELASIVDGPEAERAARVADLKRRVKGLGMDDQIEKALAARG